jgi:hypothetical protein
MHYFNMVADLGLNHGVFFGASRDDFTSVVRGGVKPIVSFRFEVFNSPVTKLDRHQVVFFRPAFMPYIN